MIVLQFKAKKAAFISALTAPIRVAKKTFAFKVGAVKAAKAIKLAKVAAVVGTLKKHPIIVPVPVPIGFPFPTGGFFKGAGALGAGALGGFGAGALGGALGAGAGALGAGAGTLGGLGAGALGGTLGGGAINSILKSSAGASGLGVGIGSGPTIGSSFGNPVQGLITGAQNIIKTAGKLMQCRMTTFYLQKNFLGSALPFFPTLTNGIASASSNIFSGSFGNHAVVEEPQEPIYR